jgi:DNA modification methylase
MDGLKTATMGDATFYTGDCRQVMASLPAGSVSMCVTSPPYYGLRDYGIPSSVWGGETGCSHEWETLDERHLRGKTKSAAQRRNVGSDVTAIESGAFCHLCHAWLGTLGLEPTPELFIEHLVEAFRAVWRVLRPDGTLWLNLGDSYAGGGGYSPDSPSNQNGSKQSTQKGALKRPGFVGASARTGMEGVNWTDTDGTVKKKAMTRVGPVAGYKPKDLMMMPARVALALQADGWYLRSDIIWHKLNPMPESVTDRPTTSHEHIFLLAKSQRYYYDADAIREANSPDGRQVTTVVGGNGSAQHRDGERWPNPNGRNKRSVWTVPTQPYPEAHFATYPEALIRPCILAGSPRESCAECGAPLVREVEPNSGGDIGESWHDHSGDADQGNVKARGGSAYRTYKRGATTGFKPTCDCNAGTTPGVVLDPFGGSGTTSLVARQEGRRSIYIDLKDEYAELAMRRLELQTPRMVGV